MSIRNARTYDKEFKNNAVALYEEGTRSYQSVADSLGIPCATLVGWVRAKEQSGEDAFPGKVILQPFSGHLEEKQRNYC